MRITSLTVVALMAAVTLCGAQENPITNGGFEELDEEGNPVDWEILGRARAVTDARSGDYAMLLERRPGDVGECGLNRVWEPHSGEQGTMLTQLKGGVRFWYRADEASDPTGLRFFVIPMSADPFENTGEPRARFTIPAHHIGDGQWHQGLLAYDFTDSDDVKWVHISPRVVGERVRLLLDDIEWVESVGPLPSIVSVSLEETPGKEGDECVVTAHVKNIGDETVDVGIASIELPRGLAAEGGPMRNVAALKPDEDAQLSWRVSGRRADRGRIGVKFTAADREAFGLLEYAPELEVVGLLAEEFIIAPRRHARVTLRLRNTGHAFVRDVETELRPGVPLSVAPELRRRSVDLIAPQTEAEVGWDVTADRQTPHAVARAVVSAANAEGDRAQTSFVVGGAFDAAETGGAQITVTTAREHALIANDRVRMVFPRSEFGYGIGLVQRRVEDRWQTVGKLPRLTRLVTQPPDGMPSEHLVYAQEAREAPGPEAETPEMAARRLELVATLTDAAGVTWTITQRVRLRPGADRIGLELTARPDGRALVCALDGPMLYAGEGAPAGTRRLDAIFPGLEWLVEGEDSSSDLDIAADHPHRIRRVPHPHMVTIPLMTARLAPPEGPEAIVALMWDHLRPYHAELNRPSAIFASPDRFEGRAATLMGLFAPSMPEYIDMNRLTAHTPLEVAAGAEVRLAAEVMVRDAEPTDTALEGMREWFAVHGAPEPRPMPHGETWRDAVSFSMQAYLHSLWIAEEERWWPYLGGPALHRRPHWSAAFLYDMRRCLDGCEEGPTREAVRERYERVVELSGLQPMADDAGFDYAGPASRLFRRADDAAALIGRQGEDGSWRFRTRIETHGIFKGKDYSELGPDGAAEVGTCARSAWTVLKFARMTGDKAAREAGLKALEFMDRFEVPRAAQVWEIPVHTPDILASSDACEAYLEGYLLTGDRAYLDKAVYWAWTGLPFVYMWDVEGFEFLRYASIPVYGATWFQGSWFGRPVQWNGMRYAYALMQLAPHDDSLDWARIARGITISCMYQQSTEDDDLALWPDGISAIDGRIIPWMFSPRAILKNVYGEMGLQPTPVTATARVGLDDIHITATGSITDAAFDVGTVSFRVTYTPPQTGYVVLSNVTRPERVRVNGVTAPEVALPSEAEAPCWRHIDYAGLLELRLDGTGEHHVEVAGVTWRESSIRAQTVTDINFNFAEDTEGWRATHQIAPLRVVGGILHTASEGVDPYMVRGNCEIPAESVGQLRIRMALEPGLPTSAQFFWTTADDPVMDEPKSRRFEVIADGEFHEFVVPLADHPRWRGTITSIRLDPTAGDPQGWVRIDYIRGE